MVKTPEQIALAVQTFAHIEANPETWDQSTWRCRTGMCFAGWTVALAGHRWLIDDPNGFDGFPGDLGLVIVEDGLPAVFGEKDGVPVIHAEDAARHLLGLDSEEADFLFAASNTFDRLRRYVGNIAAGRAAWDDGQEG